MRAVFNGKFLSASVTGVHRVAYELINALAELGYRPQVLAPPGVNTDGLSDRVEVKHVGAVKGVLWEQLVLPFSTGGRRIVSLCNLAPALSPGVVMIHDAQIHISPKSYSWAFRTYYKIIQSVIRFRAQSVLTVSDYSAGQLVRYGVCRKDQVHTIHNGCDHIARNEVARVPFNPDAPYVVALANTQHHKNIRILIEAFKSQALGDVELRLVGAADESAFVAAGMQPSGNVRFMGRISDAALSEQLSGALCLAFPSTTEGFGLPPLEAMRLGCPVVAAPCGALPEVCGDAALYAEPDSADAWVARINQCRDEQTRNHLVKAGLERADQFTWKAAATTLVKHLDELGVEI